MRPLIVGQSPSRSGEGLPPFCADRRGSGRRLADLAGIPPERLEEAFRLANLLDHYPGESFPMSEARAIADAMELEGVVLLVGRLVARAFGEGGRPWFEWFDLRGVRATVVPHPSGLNRWWNDPVNVERAGEFMREVAGRTDTSWTADTP